MSILSTNRKKLDDALQDRALTLLLLMGPLGGVEEAIHNRTEEAVTEEWRRTFLISERTLLTVTENTNWFSNAVGRYAVIGGSSRTVADLGLCADLLNADESPSVLRIRRAFSKGDQA